MEQPARRGLFDDDDEDEQQ
jgi:hypothetical protein